MKLSDHIKTPCRVEWGGWEEELDRTDPDDEIWDIWTADDTQIIIGLRKKDAEAICTAINEHDKHQDAAVMIQELQIRVKELKAAIAEQNEALKPFLGLNPTSNHTGGTK